jgi:hypothetical protein
MLCWAGSGLGSTVRQLDTRELTLDSHDIVVGEVQSVRSYWNAAHTRIFTDVTVHVTRSLKGSAGSMLTLTELGGEVDGARLDVPGCPTFRPGQQSLLFVWRDSQGRAQVNGLAQGKFDIQADPSTGERTVQRAVPGFGAHDAKTLRVVPAGQPLPRLRLDDLVREITRTMAEESNR